MARGDRIFNVAVIAMVAALVVLVLFSGSFGRAHPLGSYRPDLPPPALDNGCWSLPDGVTLDFPYQVRRDGDLETAKGERRRLVMQFDLIDAAAARNHVADAFAAGGFTERPGVDEDSLTFDKAGVGRVDATVTALDGTHPDSIVRGTVVLDLPSSPPQTDSPECSEPYSTKRFPDDDGTAP